MKILILTLMFFSFNDMTNDGSIGVARAGGDCAQGNCNKGFPSISAAAERLGSIFGKKHIEKPTLTECFEDVNRKVCPEMLNKYTVNTVNQLNAAIAKKGYTDKVIGEILGHEDWCQMVQNNYNESQKANEKNDIPTCLWIQQVVDELNKNTDRIRKIAENNRMPDKKPPPPGCDYYKTHDLTSFNSAFYMKMGCENK